MKPKTKEQKKIVEMGMKLKREELPKYKVKYMTDDLWKGFYNNRYKSHVRCLHCGKMIRCDKPGEAKGMICPECGEEFKDFAEIKSYGYSEQLVAMSVEVHWGYQVFRKYAAERKFTRTGIETTYIDEVAQTWMNDKGQVKHLCNAISAMGWRFWHYSLFNSFQLRAKTADHYSWYTDMMPKQTYIPALQNKDTREETRHEIRMSLIPYCQALLQKKYAESIQKIMGKEAFIRYMTSDAPEHCWKLALRYQYKPKNWGDWEDNIRQLIYLKMDTHNPKILLPEDLQKEHIRINELASRKRAKERVKRRLEEQKRKIEEMKAHKEEYQKRLKELLPLTFAEEGLHFTVIQSPEEMTQEGIAMHHCVAMYWNKQDSLILSCRNDDNERVETIEVNLERYNVAQSRGHCNCDTQYHDRILKIMNKNMDEIKRLDMKRRRRLKMPHRTTRVRSYVA